MSTNPQTIIQTADIPPIPIVLQQILAMTNNPNTTSKDLEKLVSQEPALVAKLLKWVNSAHYALPRRVSSISHSMILLGFSTVKSIASGLLLINAFDSLSYDDKVFVHQVWQHSLLSSNIVKILAEKEPLTKQDDLFLACMIHDVGYIVLTEYYGKKYQMLTRRHLNPTPPQEDEFLGVNHVVIGTLLLKQWHFPDEVIELVRCHHNPDEYLGEKKDIAYVMMADLLAFETDMKTLLEIPAGEAPANYVALLETIDWNWEKLAAQAKDFIDAVEVTDRILKRGKR